MARIPQDELERLKREVDLVQLVTSCGVKLSKKGADLVGLCPMHDDKEPSLVVTPSKNLWHCLGACGTGGTVIDWIMKTQAVSFRHAVEILRSGGSVQSIRNAKRSTAPLLSCPISHDATGPRLTAQLMDFYHRELLQSKAALDYLEKRGINNPEAIAHFKLGFVNRVLYYRLPTIKSAAGRAIRQHLAAAGLTRKTGHEHFAGAVVIPIADAQGEIVEIYGRRISNKLNKGQPRHLYLPGPHRGIFNLDAFRESKEIILCESLIDALTFWCTGYRHVTTAYGTNGFTTETFEALKAYGIERVLIAFDRDDAGDAAAAKLAERLGAEGISCFRVLFPRGMDANEYALKVTPPEQSLGVLLRSAQHIGGPIVTLGNPHPADPTISPVITDEKPSSSLAAVEKPSDQVKTQVTTGAPALRTTENGHRAPEPASPALPPSGGIEAEIRDHEVLINLGNRRWRVRGLARNLSFEVLKVNLLVAKGEHFHVDSLDLYSARQRGTFLKQAVEELQIKSEILRKDLGAVLLKLEELQAAEIKKQLEPEDTTVTLSVEEEAEALALLRSKDLLGRISEAFATCGLVGEHTNKLVGYLAAVSRKLTKPLAVMVQSSSAAGKSALMEAVLAFVPAEERVQYSAMTGQSLFYMGETDLKHKVLAIAEEEGAQKASYSLKLLQSEGELTIASTGKDPSSGRLVTHEYHVEGPAAILLTTTAIDLDEELLNRCVVLAVDESREQTRAIHQLQRESRTLEGLEHRLARQDTVKLHQNAQRLLKPLFIVNPFARHLTFLDDTTRTRRDHEKYLGLIDVLALLHQHQREVKTGVVRGRRVDYVEATLEDIAMANLLASEALGRTLDELPPQTRRLLFLVEEMVRTECQRLEIDPSAFRFTRRQVREHTGLGDTQLKLHLHRLVEMEYILIYPGGRSGAFLYELLYEGQGKEGDPFVLGLLDVERLGREYASNRSGSESDRSGSESDRSGSESNRSAPGRPLVGGQSGGGREEKTTAAQGRSPEKSQSLPKTAHQVPPPKPAPYPHNEPVVVMRAGARD